MRADSRPERNEIGPSIRVLIYLLLRASIALITSGSRGSDFGVKTADNSPVFIYQEFVEVPIAIPWGKNKRFCKVNRI